MPSTSAKVTTGGVAVLVLAYSVVIAQRILLGVVAASLVVLVGWVLSAGRESGAVRTLTSPYWATAFAVAFGLLAYSVVIARQVLLGVVAASLVLLGAAGVSNLRRRGYSPSLGLARTLVVVVLSFVVMGYALIVAQQILLGLLAVLSLVLVAWVTGPHGPFGGE